MLAFRSEFPPRADRRAVALVIVLAFIVLLTGLMVAFMTRVTNERNVANSSSNTDKADLLARSALDTIVADLKQEIAQGSTAATVTTGTVASTIYTPLTPANAVPVRSGTADTLPNLIRRSVRPAASPNPTPSNASPVNSATDVSANGRSVSLVRWNSSYLLPRAHPGAASTDRTPIADFTAPDWVLVNRTGPLTATPPTAWDATMASTSPGNQNYVIGRYAYAVYDEGGLLDANVAGYPSQTTLTQSGRKGRAVFADLTQLKDSANTFALTQTQIDNLLGWRTYTSTQPGLSVSAGSFPTYAFSASSATSFFHLVTGTKASPPLINEVPDPANVYTRNGFLTVAPAPAGSTQTDQGINSRQQLIQIAHSIGIAPDVLQFLGTFSRDLEQPSFAPNPNRVRIQAGPGVTLGGGTGTTGNNVATYGTGNDGYGNDDAINPAFLSVRAASTFPRNDGSTAVVGEPLVKQRFPLSRLGLVLYNKTNTASQSDPIYANFGLYRSSTSVPWQYDHGGSANGSVSRILRLSEVAQWVDPATGKAGRDPDFFELLKAAISVGSLAKGFGGTYNGQDWNVSNTAFNLQQGLDAAVDLHLLQIGANVVDQYDTDSIPTQIAFLGDPAHVVRGVEDLPYLYEVRDRAVQASASTGDYLFLPYVWNPHAQNSTPTLAPTSFRFRVDPYSTAATSQLQIQYRGVSGGAPLNLNINWPGSTPLTFNAGESAGYYGFREPTLLAELNKPAGTNLNGHTTGEFAPSGYPQPPSSPPRTLVGISPINNATFPWLADANTTHFAVKAIFASLPVINCYLEYQDPAGSGAWVTYDQKLFQWNQSDSFNTYSAPVWDINNTLNDTLTGGITTDARTARWGMAHTYFQSDVQPVPAGTSSYIYPSRRPNGGLSWGCHIGGIGDNGFVNPFMYYDPKTTDYPDRDYRGWVPGYWTENSIRVAASSGPTADGAVLTQAPPADAAHYNRSADGIVRRVMGGWASDTTNGGAAGGTSTGIVGLPMVTAANNNSGQSRPIILNRPFRSVADLGYVFRSTPWGNLNFSFPESGDAALLDLFCVNELESTNSLVAGRVNVNTRQAPVLQALIAGALTDDSMTPANPLTATQAGAVAAQLISRTTNTTGTTGPLANRAELVGRWNYNGNTAAATAAMKTDPNPDDFYTGFASDIGKVSGMSGQPAALIPRLREASIRALADSTTARTWDLLIDVVAQTGRYPTTGSSAQTLAGFNVEGERRYWLHVAIDRLTGQVLDEQFEPVNE